jgi:hypothetical protein
MRPLAGILALALAFTLAANAARAGYRVLLPPDFLQAAPQGFGDRDNSQPWAMIWWKNTLIVGTGRATACVQQAALAFHRPDLGTYPPKEEDIECTDSPQDLPLQAEIWRWTPATGEWDLLYRSPQDVPIPGHPGKFIARDIGFRGMHVFTEPGGGEALYVAGVSGRAFNQDGLPPPRLLRSTDGETFEAVPQDPGTFLGDIPFDGFRNLLTYKGKFYVLASVGQLGHGVILESADPASGNDSFRQVSPPGQTYFEIETFNGFLYLGTGVQPVNDKIPFSILKTDATGNPPYALTPIIENGADRKSLVGYAVISMQVFKNRLYAGTERELFRINPDDTWELVVGTPRTTPDGRIEPLSGMDYGFDSFFNIHMWRMAVHDGVMYLGTQDQSTKWRNGLFGKMLQAKMGFDLFATSDGLHFTEVTRNAFAGYFNHITKQVVLDPENILNNGVRNFASTPHGLFMGSANHYFGTEIWKANLPATPELVPPARLEVEGSGPSTLLHWEPTPGAIAYQIFRDTGFTPAANVGSTPNTHFIDATAEASKTHHYYVMAVSPLGKLSGPSNLTRVPFKGPIPTFSRLLKTMSDYGLPRSVKSPVFSAMRKASSGNLAGSLTILTALRAKAVTELPLVIGPVKAENLVMQIDGLIRRVNLAIAGLVDPGKLVR